MERLFLMFLDHTQRRSTVGRTPLDELITSPEESYRLWCVVVCDLETSRIGAPYTYDISSLRVNDLTLILLTWRKWWANNASKKQMGFNSGFKGLKQFSCASVGNKTLIYTCTFRHFHVIIRQYYICASLSYTSVPNCSCWYYFIKSRYFTSLH